MSLSPARQRLLTAGLKSIGGIRGWQEAMVQMEGSDLWMGRETGWRPSFDDVLKEDRASKLLEGVYSRSRRRPPPNSVAAAAARPVSASVQNRRDGFARLRASLSFDQEEPAAAGPILEAKP